MAVTKPPVRMHGAPGLARDRFGEAADISAGLGNLNSLDEIDNSLARLRQRLSVAHEAERCGLRTVIDELEARYRQRRAELA